MSTDDARGLGERELLAEALVQVDLTVFGSPQHNHDDAYLAVANILLASPQLARLIEQREAAARAEGRREVREAVEGLCDKYDARAAAMAPEDDWGESVSDTLAADTIRMVVGHYRAVLAERAGDGA